MRLTTGKVNKSIKAKPRTENLWFRAKRNKLIKKNNISQRLTPPKAGRHPLAGIINNKLCQKTSQN